MNIDICFTPNDFDDEKYSKYSAVVIDVLRATTSIATACANGCKELIPVRTVAEANKLKANNPDILLAGEREGLLIPGFNLGNSPFEYTREQVASKTIVMTTTNGTLALTKASAAQKVYAMAFVNAAAITSALQQQQDDVVIVCAGSEGRFSLEDTLCAGLLAERFSKTAKLSDTALAAQAMYRDFAAELLPRVAESSHASYLRSIGFEQDVMLCLQQDTLSVIPVFENGTITACIK
ncbi:2-phosphosulfolactate phosphatase [Sporomusa sp. GT1]|uniref:2-phosphosulfolactate phosphatase n=1 Tax=Sporomusa sp. GT1 TaxID=1534747 RepID=UPI00166D3EB4|nr:2-phosphosulfolactate phosphatase [Sporomusa sp. GT1]